VAVAKTRIDLAYVISRLGVSPRLRAQPFGQSVVALTFRIVNNDNRKRLGDLTRKHSSEDPSVELKQGIVAAQHHGQYVLVRRLWLVVEQAELTVQPSTRRIVCIPLSCKSECVAVKVAQMFLTSLLHLTQSDVLQR
jgi:hypothetical protein